ncbi:MAG TPA: DUF4349 domain-containing protein [Allosphingosinicella sp.]|nr:DUF4349 domain-containing protein [Allosphingosinicella sp.]
MRKPLGLLLLFTAAGCGQQPSNDYSGSPSASQNATEVSMDAVSESSAGPSVAVTAAPGVAFNYRYAFRLPAERVQSVQEQHAQACEKLGVDRCRITGLRYRLVNDDIEAMLAFKLDPALAREFGKQGIDAVVRAEGMLVDSEISGEDVGSKIAVARRGEGELEEELKRVEEQLARAGLRGSERAELQLQAQQLRERMRASRAVRTEQQESLATTPMTFNYGSGDLAPGFRGRPSLSRALNDAIDNFLGGLAWIFVALVTLLPWAVLTGLLIWGARRLNRRFNLVPKPTPEA